MGYKLLKYLILFLAIVFAAYSIWLVITSPDEFVFTGLDIFAFWFGSILLPVVIVFIIAFIIYKLYDQIRRTCEKIRDR